MLVEGAFVRPITRADWPYVGTTWQRSYAERSLVDKDVYAAEARRFIDRILETRHSDEAIALVSESDPRCIHAFAVGDARGYLHYVYVAGDLRGNGVARELIKRVTGCEPPILVSHRWPHKSDRYVWNPYLAGVVGL